MNKFRVWWIRNPLGPAEHHPVSSIDEAIKVLTDLANADLKSDDIVRNVGGLEELKVSKWGEYYDDDDRDIKEIMRMRC